MWLEVEGVGRLSRRVRESLLWRWWWPVFVGWLGGYESGGWVRTYIYIDNRKCKTRENTHDGPQRRGRGGGACRRVLLLVSVVVVMMTMAPCFLQPGGSSGRRPLSLLCCVLRFVWVVVGNGVCEAPVCPCAHTYIYMIQTYAHMTSNAPGAGGQGSSRARPAAAWLSRCFCRRKACWRLLVLLVVCVRERESSIPGVCG